MAFKLLTFSALLAIAHAGVVAPITYSAAPVAYRAAPVAYGAAPAYAAAPSRYEEPDLKKNYEFGYAVHDPKNNDVHDQQESRENGVVKGRYSLIEKDGSRRVVEYTADPHTGFHATVRNEPVHGQVAYEAPAPVAYAPQPAPAYYH